MTKLSAIELDALGFDPTPGDPDAFAVTVGTVRGAGTIFAEVSAVLHGAGEDTAWRGQAATGFRTLLAEDFRPLVDVAVQSLADTARALDGWVTFMHAAQSATRAMALEAAAAVVDLRRAEAALAALPLPPSPGAPLPVDLVGLRAYDAAELDYARARKRRHPRHREPGRYPHPRRPAPGHLRPRTGDRRAGCRGRRRRRAQ